MSQAGLLISIYLYMFPKFSLEVIVECNWPRPLVRGWDRAALIFWLTRGACSTWREKDAYQPRHVWPAVLTTFDTLQKFLFGTKPLLYTLHTIVIVSLSLFFNLIRFQDNFSFDLNAFTSK